MIVMKSRNVKHILYLSLLSLALAVHGCKKDDYLDDGGVHTAITPLSNYDYLAAQKYHDFDTVLMIIDHFGLKDSVNEAGTFFAPTNYNIKRLLQARQIGTLDSFYTLASSKLITQYMFSDTSITLDNATPTVKTYDNWADTIAGVKKIAETYGAVTSVFTYYTLQYVKINGYLDGTPGAPAQDPLDAILDCQTTGIRTSAGNTTLHVLSNTSSLAIK